MANVAKAEPVARSTRGAPKSRRDIIENTEIEIQALGSEMLAAMLAAYHVIANGETSLASSGLAAHREMVETSQAIAVALVTPG